MDERGEYQAFYAEFYDLLHAGLSDVDCYVEFASEYGPRILELGCGTGRILIPLAYAGFRVTGVDMAADMLDACRRKIGYENAEVAGRIRLVHSDISLLSLDEEFNLVLAPCNLLNHFLTGKEALNMLRCARSHLAPSGTFILDNSIPDFPHMVRTNGVQQTFEFTHPLTGTTIRDTFTAIYDFGAKTEVDHTILEEYSGVKLLRREETRHTLTYYLPHEVRHLLRTAGFKILHEQGSLLEDVPINAESGEMVFVCRKAE